MQKLKRFITGVMSVCLVASSMTFSPAAASIDENKIDTNTAVEMEWDKLSGILDDYIGVYDKNTKLGSPWNTGFSPDGPLMGNGTVYAFMAGDRKTQNLYISHSNMWQDRPSNNGQEYTTFGGITIKQANGQNAESLQEFRYEQDMKNAELRAQSELGFTTLSWLSAKENIIVTEITNVTENNLPIEVSAWAANSNTTARVNDDAMIATKKGISKPKDRDSGTGKWEGWNVNISMASKIIDDIDKTTQNLDSKKNITTFTLQPGQTVTMVSAIEGGKEEGTKNTLEQSTEKALDKLASRSSKASLASAKQNHLEYWKEYWMKSYIDIQDADVERMYYGMLYQLGCSTSVSSENNGGVAAGLFPWTANDHPAWQGDYTTNTDFQRQIHPLVQANRTSGIQNYLNILHQYWPEASRRSNSVKNLNWIIEGTPRPEKFTSGIEGGALFPTHIGPWGASTEQFDSRNDYWNSPADATSVLMPVVKMWKYTQDEDLLKELYPLMKSVSIFWENFISLENGKYVVYGATHENVPGRNPIFDVDACKYMLKNTIIAANQLQTDANKIAVWQNILDHMSDVPTMQYRGKTTICDVEGRTESNTGNTFDGNPVTIQSAYYYDAVGMSTSDAEKEKYINYLNVKNGMGSHRRLISATRLGYDIHEIIDQLKVGSINKSPGDWEGMRGNNTIGDIGGTGRLAIVQDSLLQSNEGFVNVFANWFDDQEASFRRMGAEDAFLVDADQNEFGQVTYLNIYSEKGKSCSVLNPWPGQEMEVYENGNLTEAVKTQNSLGTVYTFETKLKTNYELKPAGDLEGILRLDTVKAEMNVGSSKKLTAATNLENVSVKWITSDPEIAVVGVDGTVVALSEGTAVITASIKNTELSAECEVTVTENKEKNIAPLGTATSNSHHENLVAQRALNGDWYPAYEGWTSANESWADVSSRWLAIDLGQEYTIKRWVLKHDGHRSQNTEDPIGDPNDAGNWGDYYLQISENGIDGWQTVDSKMNNVNNTTDQTLKEAVTGRYFRIYMEFPMFQAAVGWKWPKGFARLDQVELYTPVVQQAINITEIEVPKDLIVIPGVPFDGLALPQELKVKLDNGTFINVAITWDKGEYNNEGTGTYILNGTPSLPSAIGNPEHLKAVITVHVSKPDKTKLKDLYDKYVNLPRGIYTRESWKELQTALAAAKSVLDNEQAQPGEIQEALVQIQTAVDKLEEIQGIEIDQQDLIVFAGDKEQLTARSGREEKILWSSSNDQTVLLGKNGEMTAVSEGETTITASLEGTEYQAICKVTVKKGNVNYSLEASSINASSVHEDFSASKIADGKTSGGDGSNAWVSENKPLAEPKWVEMDFASPVTINKWKITHVAAQGDPKSITRDFSLQVSDDKVRWTNVDSVFGNTDLVNERGLNEAVTASHFRLYITTADNYNGQWPNNMARIDELELLYETGDVSIETVTEPQLIKVSPVTTVEKLKTLLPEKVEAGLNNGFTALVSADWNTDAYQEMPGTYQLRGTLVLPETVLNEKHKEITVTVQVEKYKISSMEQVENLQVNLGTTYEELVLPKSVEAVMDDGSKQEVNLIWSGDYDGNEPGDYMLVGTPELGTLYENPDNVTVSIKITVNNTQTIVAVNLLEDIKTAYGTTQEELAAKLPSEVLVRLNTGQVCYLPVNWESTGYDPNMAGSYLFHGILNAGEYENPENLEAVIHIIVLEAGIPAPEDLQALRQAVTDAKGISGDDYTKESYDRLLETIKDAENTLDDPDSVVDRIHEKTQAIIDAIKALEKKPCNHPDTEKITLLEAACSSEGLDIVKCRTCGEIISQESIPALGHVFGEWVIKEEATIFKDGWKERICSVDHEAETCVIEKLPSCRVAFLDADNRVIGEVQTIAINGTAKAPEAPTKAGYRFVGWEQEFTNVTKDIVISASYEIITYKISYLYAEESDIRNPLSYTVVDTVALSSPVKEGYKFAGWYQGNSRVDGISKGTTGDITLTAKWNKELSKDIGTLDIKAIQNQIYTGKGICPEVTVKDGNRILKENIHYVVRYANNTRPGRAVVTIQGVGEKYTGKEDKTFEIIAAKNKSFTVGKFKYTVTDASTVKGTVKLTAPTKRSFTSLTIPSSVKIGNYVYKVTEIGTKAFRNNKSLKKVVIGKNVKKVSAYAFDGDKSLKNVKISSKMIKEVGKKAFRGIDKKAVIKVPSGKFRTYQKLLAKKGQGKDVKISK